MQQNRLSPPSRWPSDPEKRLERARTDIAFAETLHKLGCASEALTLLSFKAQCIVISENENN